jgi:hypothetical protein
MNRVFKSETPCPGCGEVGFHTNYMCAEGERMKKTGECFTCAFWELRCERGCPVVIDHWVYGIGKEPSPLSISRHGGGALGMGGRRFDIEFTAGPHTGKRCTTHNLWSGGEIPERYRHRLPNTARFVGGTREKAGDTTCWDQADERLPAYPAFKGAS